MTNDERIRFLCEPIVFREGEYYSVRDGQVVQLTAGEQKPAERPLCQACQSPDTVSYWDIKPTPERRIDIAPMLKPYYPNARKCVDCEHVWW